MWSRSLSNVSARDTDFSQGLDTPQNRTQLHVATFHFACVEACEALGTASHALSTQPSCIPLGWLLRFFTKFFDIHVLVLHSFLSPCAKRDLCPGNIVDVRGNATRELELVYCFTLDIIPVHWMPGSQALTSVPTQLITDVDSMLPCLDFSSIFPYLPLGCNAFSYRDSAGAHYMIAWILPHWAHIHIF